MDESHGANVQGRLGRIRRTGAVGLQALRDAPALRAKAEIALKKIAPFLMGRMT